MKMLTLIGATLISMGAVASDKGLADFTTDGCSMFPDGTPEQPTLWQNCCVLHDIAYWQGGSFQQRLQADKALAACVTAHGKLDLAKVMFAGVRVGGSPYLPTSYRWGYGWAFPRGYKVVSDIERTQINEKLKHVSHIQMLDVTEAVQ